MPTFDLRYTVYRTGFHDYVPRYVTVTTSPYVYRCYLPPHGGPYLHVDVVGGVPFTIPIPRLLLQLRLYVPYLRVSVTFHFYLSFAFPTRCVLVTVLVCYYFVVTSDLPSFVVVPRFTVVVGVVDFPRDLIVLPAYIYLDVTLLFVSRCSYRFCYVTFPVHSGFVHVLSCLRLR